MRYLQVQLKERVRIRKTRFIPKANRKRFRSHKAGEKTPEKCKKIAMHLAQVCWNCKAICFLFAEWYWESSPQEEAAQRWRNGSGTKRAGSSSRGPEFSSQTLTSVLAILGVLMFSSGLLRHQSQMWYTGKHLYIKIK